MTKKYQNITEISDEAARIKTNHFTTTLPEIDKQIDGGFRSSTFNVVVADSGLGKSNYLIRLALELAKQGVRVHLVSVEMGKKDVIDRLLAMAGDISFNKLQDQKEEYIAELHEALGLLRENLFLTFRDDINDILEDIETLKDEQHTQVVLVDHIHAITSQSVSEYVEEMTLLRAFKKLWTEQRLCIIAAAQLRKMTPGEVKQALGEKENIRGSAKWFHFASQFLYFMETKTQKEHNYQGERPPGDPNFLTLILSKSRYRSEGYSPVHLLESKPWKGEFKYVRPLTLES
jgi:replicative DNA helicase